MAKLPKAPFEKILKESVSNIRVSDAGALALAQAIEEIARKIAADAAELATHANRKTILEEDVKFAVKKKFE